MDPAQQQQQELDGVSHPATSSSSSQDEILAALPDRALAAFIKQRLLEGVALRDIRFIDECGAPAQVLTSLADPSSAPRPCRLIDWIQCAVEWTDGCRYLSLPNCLASAMPYPPTVQWGSELWQLHPDMYALHLKDLRLLTHYTQLYKAEQPTLQPLPIDDDGDDEGVDEPYWKLLDWEDAATGSRVWDAEVVHSALPACTTTCCNLVASRIDAARQRLQHVSHTQQDWSVRLGSSCPLLLDAHKAIPWSREGRAGVVLAGGAVASMVCPGTTPGDGDLFTVLPGSCKLPRAAVNKQVSALCSTVLAALQAAASRQRLYSYVKFRPRHITFFALKCPFHSEVVEAWQLAHPGEDCLVHKVQIILRAYHTPAQVVHGFDVDACSLLYDGTSVWATERAALAWHAGFMIASPARQSPSYEHRLLKYSLRYGLHILIPGFPAAVAQVITGYLDHAKEDWLAAVRSLDEAGYYLMVQERPPWGDRSRRLAAQAALKRFLEEHPELQEAIQAKDPSHLRAFPICHGRIGQVHRSVAGVGRLLIKIWLEGLSQELEQGRHTGRAALELRSFVSSSQLHAGLVNYYEDPQDLEGINTQCMHGPWFSWWSQVLSGRAKTASRWEQALTSHFAELQVYQQMSCIPHFQEGQAAQAGLFSGSFSPLPDRDFFESARAQLQFMFERGYLTALPVQFTQLPDPAQAVAAAAEAPAVEGLEQVGRWWAAALECAAVGVAMGALGTALQGGKPKWVLALLLGCSSAALHALPSALKAALTRPKQQSRKAWGKSWAVLLPSLAYD